MNKKFLIKAIFGMFFVSFVISYVIGESGYYEYELANKKYLTEEEMKKFEEDVRNGENIDLKDYTVETRKDYTNKFTDVVTNTSLTINEYLKKTIESVFGLLNKMIEE